MNQSALRTLRLLEYLGEAGPSSLTSIAESLQLNKSTAHRFVSTLVETGYARQDPRTRSYSLTTRVLELGALILKRIEIREEVRPFLEETARMTAETAHLAVLEGLEIVYVDKVEGAQAVQMASRIGLRGACHSTALGKVLLSARPEEEWDRYLAERDLTARTRHTIVDPGELFDELRRVRKQGHAVDNVENEEGIRCVAAPIRDHTGEVVAAMSVSGWTVSMTPARVRALVPVLKEQAARASGHLGSVVPAG